MKKSFFDLTDLRVGEDIVIFGIGYEEQQTLLRVRTGKQLQIGLTADPSPDFCLVNVDELMGIASHAVASQGVAFELVALHDSTGNVLEDETALFKDETREDDPNDAYKNVREARYRVIARK